MSIGSHRILRLNVCLLVLLPDLISACSLVVISLSCGFTRSSTTFTLWMANEVNCVVALTHLQIFFYKACIHILSHLPVFHLELQMVVMSSTMCGRLSV